MKNPSPESLQAELQRQLLALKQVYETELPERLAEIDACWEELTQAAWQPDAANSLCALVHRIAGSGATFGFAELSERAGRIERIVRMWAGTDDAPEHRALDEVRSLIEKLRQAAGAMQGSLAAVPEPVSPAIPPEHALIFVVEDDPLQAEAMVVQLQRFGYRAECFGSVPEARAALERRKPAAAVVDIILPEGDLAGAHLLQDLKREGGLGFPVLFCTVRGDFDARLAAVRAGADAYLVKPVDMDAVTAHLDRLTGRAAESPYRILIVDDDPLLARHYALVLEGAGMVVQAISQPGDTLTAVSETEPDLIVMDLYMPQCSGFELAKLIRQQERFMSTPIVFLSTERDVDKQLLAMRMGGDEFLTKPIEDAHLLAAVSIRAARARTLNALMVQDSLTGLLKHTKVKEQLEAELSRAERHGTDLAFAMIDIDRFKAINDHYGHLAGDRVIKSLARLLRQRVRRSDVVGRYGGEEFAVIFPACSVDSAARSIDRIRADFCQISHHHGEAEFTVSLSAGVAGLSSRRSVGGMIDAADQALYQAKQHGRNRTVTAPIEPRSP